MQNKRDHHGPVRAGGGEPLPSWAEGDGADDAGMPREGQDRGSGLRVPELHHPGPAGRGEPVAVGTEGHAQDRACLPIGRCGSAWPVSASQSLTVPSLPAVAICRPSGRKVTPKTDSVWPSEAVEFTAGVGVPELHGPVRAGGSKALPVRAENHAVDDSLVPSDDQDLTSGRDLPDPDGAVLPCRGEPFPVGGKAHAINRSIMAPKDMELGAGGGVRESHRLVAAGRGEARPSLLKATSKTIPACLRSSRGGPEKAP